MERLFRDRHDAGQQLAQRLKAYAACPEAIVLALPRGGVPVGYEVARSLGAPLEAFIVRKLGVPGHRELAMGALAAGGVRVLNANVVWALGPRAQRALERVTAKEIQELKRREERYRGERPFPKLQGRTVILVDDGLATGATMRAAAQAVRPQAPKALVVAVPVASEPTCRALRDQVDELICAFMPENFAAVGQFYQDFSQTSDEEVRELLARASSAASAHEGPHEQSMRPFEHEVSPPQNPFAKRRPQ
jgi:predicted phosphoribosyltransferase